MLGFTVKINGQAQLTLTITPLAGLFKSESFSASLGNIVQHTLSMQPMLVLLRSINLQSPSLPIARSILYIRYSAIHKLNNTNWHTGQQMRSKLTYNWHFPHMIHCETNFFAIMAVASIFFVIRMVEIMLPKFVNYIYAQWFQYNIALKKPGVSFKLSVWKIYIKQFTTSNTHRIYMHICMVENRYIRMMVLSFYLYVNVSLSL